jgi:hypothetical protein
MRWFTRPSLIDRTGQLAPPRPAQSHERVDQADLDAFESRHVRQQRLRGVGVQVVDQDPHANAARRRIAQCLQEHSARGVPMQYKGLQIERLPRLRCQLDQGFVRRRSHREQLERRTVARSNQGLARSDREPRLGGRGQRERSRRVDRRAVRQAGATRQGRQRQPEPPVSAVTEPCAGQQGHAPRLTRPVGFSGRPPFTIWTV